MRRRNIHLIGLIFLLILSLLAGCRMNEAIKGRDDKQMCYELIGYLENNDTEGIKSMLSVKTLASPNIDEEVMAAVELFDGKVTSPDSIDFGTAMSGYEEGETHYLITSIIADNIETDSQKKYSIWLRAQFTNSENSDAAGVYLIEISDEEGNRCAIGETLDRFKEYA